MKINDFHKDFFEEVKATAASEGEGSSAAFVGVFSNYLIGAEVLSDFTPSFFGGTGKNNRRLRVDGHSFEEFDKTFTLIVADYSGDLSRDVVTKSVAITIFDRLVYFIDEVYNNRLTRKLEPSTPASDLVDLIIEKKEITQKFRLVLFTDGFMSNRISSIDSIEINGVPCDFQIWDIDRLFRVCASETGRQDIEIDFTDFSSNGIPCIKASASDTEDFSSYLCIIPGTVLADLYDHHGSQLLESNVRSFLSTKVAVNRKIRETILRVPENFFAYNNGVAATAMDLVVRDTRSGSYITYAKNFQIINGGQTTASLSNARFKDNADLSKIFVQMKLTQIDSNEEKSTDLIRNISRSSNSQNRVSDADFFSTHPFHIRMEQISRRVYAPAPRGVQHETKWFYERARGQYLQAQMHMTKSQKDKFTTQNPKKQLIVKTDLAKARNTWLRLPHVVSKGAQTNFMNFAEAIDNSWSSDDSHFNEKYYRDTVSILIMFKRTEWLVSNASWYQSGYRANIVTYSLALLSELINKQFKGKVLDFQLIWNRQEVPEIIEKELINITKLVYDSITDPSRGIVNVTQWCKREECWKTVKAIAYELSAEFSKVLLDPHEKKAEEKEAKKDQEFISEVEAQSIVLDLGAKFWTEVEAFSKANRVKISPSQLTALKYAVRIPTQFPSAYQSLQLLSLLESARENGFKK